MGGGHHKEEDPCGTQIAFVLPSLVFTHFEKSLTGSDFILVNMTVIFFFQNRKHFYQMYCLSTKWKRESSSLKNIDM